jgi:hypothetical protein
MTGKMLLVGIMFSGVALAQSQYEPNAEQDREDNVGCLSSKCMSNMVLNNRNLPMVRVAPAFTTRLKFPREIVKCEDDTDTIKVCDADRLKECEQDKGAGEKGDVNRKPFLQARIKVIADKSKITGSIFALPAVNVVCDFTNGETVTFYVKVSEDPHHIVRFVDGVEEQSGLAWLFEQEGRARAIPIELGPKRAAPAAGSVVHFDDGRGSNVRRSERDVLETLFAGEKEGGRK